MFLALLAAGVGLAQGCETLCARDEVYEDGVRLRVSGAHQAAAGRFEQLLKANPDDIDARLQLGLTLAADGRPDEAHTQLEQVVRVAPDYDDARIALARIAAARGDRDGARAWLDPALARRPADRDSLTVQAQINAIEADARWRVDVALSHSSLSNDLADWREVNISASRRLGRMSALAVRAQALERFGASETYVEAEYDGAWSSGEWFVALGGSLAPQFRPERTFKAGASLIPAPGAPWRIVTGLALSRYVVGDVTSAHIGAERQLGGGRGRIGARWIHTIDEGGRTIEGYGVNGAWRLTDPLELSASYVDAPESSDGQTVGVRGYFLGATFDVDARASVRAGLAHESRDSGYDRVEASVGATYRF